MSDCEFCGHEEHEGRVCRIETRIACHVSHGTYRPCNCLPSMERKIRAMMQKPSPSEPSMRSDS